MPIYEFYCPTCNTIFNFLSKSINTEKRPACPSCSKDSLQRMVSKFAVVSGSKTKEKPGGEEGEGGASNDPLDNLPIDEAKMERAMTELASDAEGMNEEDPRAAAQLMRKFSNLTGLQFNEKMQEALNRLESGEDPDAIEAEMGDALGEDENPFVLPDQAGGTGKVRPKKPRPKRDETLYDM